MQSLQPRQLYPDPDGVCRGEHEQYHENESTYLGHYVLGSPIEAIVDVNKYMYQECIDNPDKDPSIDYLYMYGDSQLDHLY